MNNIVKLNLFLNTLLAISLIKITKHLLIQFN